MAYTYDDFVTAAQGAGLYDTFSQEDLTAAQTRPEYGMSLLKLQQEVNGAATAEQRLLAQEALNQLRGSYIPGSTEYSYSGQTAYDKALQGVTGAPGYSFDYRTDPYYGQIKNQYLGDIGGARDQLLDSTAVSGGSKLPSYADAATGQSKSYYDTRLNDIIPTVEQNAYNRYLQGLGILNDQYSAAAEEKSFDYNKWLQEQSLGMAAMQQQFANDLALHQNFGTDAPGVPMMNGGASVQGPQYSYGQDEGYQKALAEVLNHGSFSYDPSSDPLYGSLRKSFLREGQRAGENALAQASAGSMGVPSSYALRLSADARNGYLEQLMNGVPTLENNAYSRYLQEFASKQAGLDALKSDRELDFNQWLQNYQLEQQRKQQMFDNALTMYGVTGLTPEIAAILGVPYVAPGSGGEDDEGRSYGYTWDDIASAVNFVDAMLGNATSSRFDPERVISGTPESTLTSVQKELAQTYLDAALDSGRMTSGVSVPK